ncbi:MAG: CDP-2,3-bis-(O-geranylgeranyl)-sn-glycerol synthase [Nitrososphaerota archaeon]|nr:CDP-2,3-bis-(O-geranylgeranyl)-sn-glycerol synthase [Candidatus Bathyarchaeota archaeon]MDW8048641.1 CDP-2,3-bis-(O-geranylgeranyl)-sn-glycerol synthase [Nitrososphaerota archaeon]
MILEVLSSLYYIFPAYCANAAPVIFGGGHPIDCNKKFCDGKPIFGSHKTIRGFLSGIVIGVLVGWVQESLTPIIGVHGGGVILGLALSFGALVGDLLGSFIKRRLGMEPGSHLPVSDQIDFVLVALLFGYLVKPISLTQTIIIIVLTGPIHVIVNFFAYLLRLKDTPW